MATGVPYAAAPGIFTALTDMIPIVGSTLAGTVVSLVALSAPLPVAIATRVFHVTFRGAEDYLIVPRALRFTVDVLALDEYVFPGKEQAGRPEGDDRFDLSEGGHRAPTKKQIPLIYDVGHRASRIYRHT